MTCLPSVKVTIELTVLASPLWSARVGLSLMNCPSTTGMNAAVPLKASLLICTLAYCKVVTSAALKHVTGLGEYVHLAYSRSERFTIFI